MRKGARPRAIGAAGAIALGGIAIACASAPPAPKEPAKCDVQTVTLSLLTAPLINPTLKGEPRPVQVRVYQLKSDVRLQNATFEQVWQDDKATLQDDIVKVDEVSVYPDERAVMQFARNPAAASVAAVALFRAPKGKTWFTSVDLPLPPGKEACAKKCSGPGCDGGIVLDPKIAMWIEDTRVEDGAGHEDDATRPRESRVLTVKAAPPPEEKK